VAGAWPPGSTGHAAPYGVGACVARLGKAMQAIRSRAAVSSR
jgi:hypothetical protein